MNATVQIGSWIGGGFIGAILSLILAFFAISWARRKLPIAHYVAVIGYPRSGKTTLITALFAEIFSRKIKHLAITPRGEETINRVNEDIARLERGEELGATTDQDLFAYRADMTTRRGPFTRYYKIEIGDFPGEDSRKLAEDGGEPSNKTIQWLHNLPYFKWVLSADAFIFVVDSEKVIAKEGSEVYRSQLTSSFRAAWQRLKDHHYDGEKRLRNKPIVLVFSKSDLLYGLLEISDKDVFAEVENGLLDEYSDLIAYLKSETEKFSLVFSSSFRKDSETGIRMGARKLLEGVLPR
ncbi:MAG: GTPase domain-containing protein [Candidatus Thiosymbion ectosymbiont of Robbea hypermnestra]|nr:GTPase domain-containing protein [Candidatus Thiosymbion ectosymbiont of Robbea hypermnestra]